MGWKLHIWFNHLPTHPHILYQCSLLGLRISYSCCSCNYKTERCFHLDLLLILKQTYSLKMRPCSKIGDPHVVSYAPEVMFCCENANTCFWHVFSLTAESKSFQMWINITLWNNIPDPALSARLGKMTSWGSFLPELFCESNNSLEVWTPDIYFNQTFSSLAIKLWNKHQLFQAPK